MPAAGRQAELPGAPETAKTSVSPFTQPNHPSTACCVFLPCVLVKMLGYFLNGK